VAQAPRVGPHTLSGKKITFWEEGVKKSVCLSVRNAPKGNKIGVNK
jgi:hypothetical protein